MLVVTLHGQTQPVFVDLREQTQGRWELETPPDEEEEEDEDDEDAPRIIRFVLPFCEPLSTCSDTGRAGRLLLSLVSTLEET
jgi:hypothetical protein